MKAKVETAVCDLGDEKVATQTISWKIGAGQPSKVNDLCDDHYAMLSGNAHSPTKGRRAGSKNVIANKRMKRKPAAKRKR